MELTGAKYKYTIFDPTTNLNLKNPISCGYIYFLKLVHRSSDKLSARSIGPYSRKTLQPLGGKKRSGGHKLGEMEVWALLSHGSKKFLEDLLTIHSDSPGLKNELLAKILENPLLSEMDKSDKMPQSLRLLNAYMLTLGLDINGENISKLTKE
jgi:DNA-directed RNA polymerase subunit beta